MVNGNCRCTERRYIRHCEDYELKAECERAEFELVDWVNAVMSFARTLQLSHPEPGVNGDFVSASDMAKLSFAIEVNRPVPDCATGLLTNTRISDGICFSQELLTQCEFARDNVEFYINDVLTQLRRQNATDKFISKLELRIINSIIPTITCKTTQAIISTASHTMISISMLGLLVTVVI